ncbi:WXG100 family type VII secretion target [Pseudonocardia xinjiangensis]|uniref:WXG100 family type VII secretion target n=1 Tax=Pseudonocardia xinjiangensis TaxID=75289 RepID=UPI003D8ADB97
MSEPGPPAEPTPPGSTTLVAEPDGEIPVLEGTGLASSWADLGDAVAQEQPDGLTIAFAAAGAGLDTLGAVTDPFDEVLSSGAGWLIEHVWFLREPLDALAGDPQQVIAQARTWSNIAAELRSIAADQTATGVPGWSGQAGEAYRDAVHRYTRSVVDVAGQADDVAAVVLGSGAAVGTVRALVRDLIADFLAWAVRQAISALAAATVTAGASTAVAVTAIALEAYRLARLITEHLARLLDELSDAGDTVGRLVDGMRHAVVEARPTASHMHESLEKVPAAEVTEAGKQVSGAELDEPPSEEPPGEEPPDR